MIYSGIIVSDQVDGGRSEASIETLSDRVKISYQNNCLEWQNNAISLERGGSGKQLIYIKNRNSDLVLYTRDKSILKDPSLTSHESIRHETKKLRKGIFKSRMFILSVLAVIVLIPVSFFVFRSFFVDAVAAKVPVKWEKKAGDELFSAVKLQYKIIEDSVISAKFDSLFNPIVKVANYSDIDFQFYLCEDPSLNAFALPGGHIVINTGTIHKIKRIEELHGVLAHEIAHVTKRHHVRGLVGNAGMFLVLQGFLGGEAGLIGTLGESAGQLSSLFYSREYETESDKVGFGYLTDANIDPSGMVDFFERIQKEYSKMGMDSLSEKTGGLSNYLSTHPDTQERIDYLKEMVISQKRDFAPQVFSAEDLRTFIDQRLDK